MLALTFQFLFLKSQTSLTLLKKRYDKRIGKLVKFATFAN